MKTRFKTLLTLAAALLLAVSLAAGCKKGEEANEGEKKEGEAAEKKGEDGEWRTIEYGTVTIYERNKKLPYADFTMVHTGVRRDATGEGDAVEFKVFKLTKDKEELTLEWPVGMKQAQKFKFGGKDFLFEVEGSFVSDFVLKDNELLVWTKQALGEELFEEKLMEKKMEKWEEKQGEKTKEKK